MADTLKVYQLMARFLAQNKLGPLFGLVGDANLYLVDSFVREFGGTYVGAAHESGAAQMALGYAAVSGRVGFATVTHGPAVTNTVTALAEGVKAFTPLVLLCGDTPVVERENLQDIPQREVILASGAGFEAVRTPATAIDDLARAIRRAWAERRPIALNIPSDLQHHAAEAPRHIALASSAPVVAPAGADLDDAVGILAAARRPIVLAGRGATDDAARDALLRLAKRLAAPVATTLKARGLFRGADYDLGIFGTLSTPAAVDAILRSDCVIAFGASLQRYTTSDGAYLRGKRVVQVSAVPADLGRFHAPDVGLVGDAVATADALVRWLDEAEVAPSGFRDELPRTGLSIHPAPAVSGDRLDFVDALMHLDRILPTDRVLVTDAGRFLVKTFQHLGTLSPRHFLQAVSFGSIGLGMGHAIGAAYAEPERPVVLVVGDGGFMLGGLTEFNTAVRHRLDLIVVLCNDSSYGAEHVQLRAKQMDPGLILFDWPAFAPLAEALGGRGVTVRSCADFAAVETAVRERDRPLLIDLSLDPDAMPFY